MTVLHHGVARVRGLELHYDEAGEGPLMLCVHGFPSCAASFRFQVEHFAADHRVVAIDALGANRSSKPDRLEAYRIDHLVELLDEFAHAIGGDDPFVLVGHDWGAALAWAFAQTLPERLEAVIAIAAPPYDQLLELLRTSPDQRERSSYMWTMRAGAQHRFMTGNEGRDLWEYIYAPLRALPHVSEELDEEFAAALAVPGAIDAGIDWYRANIPDLDRLEHLQASAVRSASTPVPALQIWGDDDATFVPEFLDGLSAYADDVSVHRMADTRHWPMVERPDDVNRAIRRFLGRPLTSR